MGVCSNNKIDKNFQVNGSGTHYHQSKNQAKIPKNDIHDFRICATSYMWYRPRVKSMQNNLVLSCDIIWRNKNCGGYLPRQDNMKAGNYVLQYENYSYRYANVKINPIKTKNTKTNQYCRGCNGPKRLVPRVLLYFRNFLKWGCIFLLIFPVLVWLYFQM